jgi:single-stranded DNA-specific DHH superfamily exonuclease
MITQEEIEKIRSYLEKSENPLFFFDDDQDGLASFLLLWKHIGRGHGVVVKGSPELTEEYARKVNEYAPDKVFILDKPMLSQDFVNKVNVPIIHIDHHPPIKVKGTHYFNPLLHDPKDNRPTSYWCYQVTKKNRWIAMIGIVGDWFIPEFAKDFAKKHPKLLPRVTTPPDALFNTEFGKLVKAFGFIQKGKTSDTMRCIRILTRIKEPEEILDQTTKEGKFIFKYYEKVNKEYELLLEQAKKSSTDGKMINFIYNTIKNSFTGNLSNELAAKYPDKLVIIGRDKGDRVIMSLRSEKYNIQKMMKEVVEDLDGYGGGHEHACGANISKEDYPTFIERLKERI